MKKPQKPKVTPRAVPLTASQVAANLHGAAGAYERHGVRTRRLIEAEVARRCAEVLASRVEPPDKRDRMTAADHRSERARYSVDVDDTGDIGPMETWDDLLSAPPPSSRRYSRRSRTESRSQGLADRPG